MTDLEEVPACGKGTSNGAAARASRYGFGPCILPGDHAPRPCDSGPVQ